MGIWAETIAIACAGLVVLYLAARFYVAVLLYLGSRFNGALKAIAGFLVYVLFAVVLVSPLFFMIGNSHRYPTQKGNWVYLLFEGACFLMSASCAVWYVFKVKIRELRANGYYLKK